MSQLLSLRGRVAVLLAVAMLAVAALALVLLDRQLDTPAQPTWEDAVTALLNDPFLGSSQSLLDGSAGGGTTGGDGLVLVGAWLVLVPITARVAWLIAGRVARPLVEVADAVEAAGPGTVARRVSFDPLQHDEFRRLGEAINGLMDRFEEHEAERRGLVDDAAHEVRNPLAVMRMTLDVALADVDDADSLRAAAEVSQRSGERIARTIDSLQDGFRDRAPRSTRSSVDLASIATELARDYAGVAARRGVGMELRAPGGLLVVADRDALRRALENLLVNALRFAPAGSPVVIGAGAVAGWRWFGVRDFGPGISPEDQALVFGRGWRGAGPGAGQGSGIGLALVRQIAEAHGGTVRLSSVPRAGSSFVVWLPTAEPEGVERVRIDGMADPLWWPIAPAGTSSRPSPHLLPRPSILQA